jgi:hypothetical protein
VKSTAYVRCKLGPALDAEIKGKSRGLTRQRIDFQRPGYTYVGIRGEGEEGSNTWQIRDDLGVMKGQPLLLDEF